MLAHLTMTVRNLALTTITRISTPPPPTPSPYHVMHNVLNPKKATIQISALIQTTYCSSLKFIIAFERRMRKNTQFYTHGRKASNHMKLHPLKLNTISCLN